MRPPSVALHTRSWNAAGSRAALLLHGLGSDGSTTWRLADHLAGVGYRVVAPDLRGQGLSPAAAVYGVEDMAGDVRLLGHDWDLVVGHSLGGAVGALLLADEGFAPRGLLLDPVLHIDERDKPDVTRMLLGEVGGALTVATVQAANPTWDDEDVFRLVRASAGISPHVVRRVVSDTTPWDLLHSAKTWPDRVTILAADPAAGALFTPDDAERLRRLRSDVRVMTVAQAGHSIHRDAPATVLAAIDGLVADV